MNIRGLAFGLLAMMGFWGAAQAATTYDLPDPAIYASFNSSFNRTYVTVAGKSYSGTSQFYYVGECALPDTATRHCNVLEEDDVTLTATDGSTIIVTIVGQHQSVLIRSGHNYWRQSDTVTGGTVTLP
jgi:hypothetical protein